MNRILSLFFMMLLLISCTKGSQRVTIKPSSSCLDASGGQISVEAPFPIYEIMILDSREEKLKSISPVEYWQDETYYAETQCAWIDIGFESRKESWPETIQIAVQPNNSNVSRLLYVRLFGVDHYGTVRIYQDADL